MAQPALCSTEAGTGGVEEAMNGRSSNLLILVAMVLVFLAFAGRATPLALLAIIIGGVGVAGMIASGARKPELPPGSNELEERIQQLEKRLQLTEDELAASNRELTTLKDEREFDRELYSGRTKPTPESGEPDQA